VAILPRKIRGHTYTFQFGITRSERDEISTVPLDSPEFPPV
jgi:hypothetical protein